ncbi:ATP-binding protein [Aquisphaera insulae]|uniref:ATP-binding protein n=1 Tax=Aquisphaera insulae TaxID=2712864 RepID=UPI0013EC778E|nr:ATP-binding protein [Aquisphaera insulae]
MNDTPVNLENCEQEPIRIPGSIQPHGALVAVGADTLCISHASQNLAEFFGLRAEEVLGKPLSILFEEADHDRVGEGIAGLAGGGLPRYLYTIRPRGGESTFDAIVHRAGDSVILEFEAAHAGPGSGLPSADLYRQTQAAISRLRKASSQAEAKQFCAEWVREIAGFDRVMIYRFDAEWNGCVVAEAKRPDLEPFLGLHYPASDIPAQARALYAQNWLRFLADRDYRPVPILPPSGPTATAPLDLSHSVLRSVSPIHLEYLRNMGVAASMSISLLKEEALWGLVACHHESPRYVPYDIRTACELLGQVMSMLLTGREDRDLALYSERMASVRAAIAERLRRMEQVPLALTAIAPTILDLLDSGGAAVLLDGEVTRVGLAPAPEDILAIAERLAATGAGAIFQTESVGTSLGVHSIAAVAAGLLAVSLGEGGGDWLMWFRPEQIREVDWAGDPSKTLQKGEGGVRLSPRGSFSLWKQQVRGRSQPWSPAELAAAADLRRDLTEALMARAADLMRQNLALRRGDVEKEELLASERAARSEAERTARLKDEFVATLSHELRTPLNAILGWTQILRRVSDPNAIREAVEVIERNTRVQAAMVEDLLDASRIASGKLRIDVQQVNLVKVVEAAVETIAPAAAAKGVRIDRLFDPLLELKVSGDPTRLQQVFWNLLSNAVKFTPKGGKIQAIIERLDSDVVVSIADTGQGIDPGFLPHIFDRFRQEDSSTNRHHGGLGLGLSIVRHLVELHGGTIFARTAGPDRGSTFVVSLPLRAVSVEGRRDGAHPLRSDGPIEADPLDLRGVRILVVDDEPDAREMLRLVLEDCGAEVGTAGSAEEGVAAFRGGSWQAIVSDIGMPGIDGYEFIRRIRRLENESGLARCPAVALTAYARADDRRRVLLSGFQIHVAKPVEPAELTTVIATLVDKV